MQSVKTVPFSLVFIGVFTFFIVSGYPVTGMKDFFRRTWMVKGGIVTLQFL